MGASEQRAAAALRRRAAELAGESGGDQAYRQHRAAAPGVRGARVVPTAAKHAQLRAKMDTRNGQQMYHTEGFFTRYNMSYPMWDVHGEYDEVIAKGACRKTIASDPDVAFLVNHRGVTMARTHTKSRIRDRTLILEERDEGGWHEAWLNPERQDVRDIVVAIQDGDVDQMSFAFMIPDGGGLWSEDFTTYEIRRLDMDRGDVSAVNYGASPHTDISARTAEVLNDLEHLPAGAVQEARSRLNRRDRVEVRRPVAPMAAPEGASPGLRALYWTIGHTHQRFADVAARQGLTVADLGGVKLPWYEIRNAVNEEDPAGVEEETATVFIFDEIGGSFGVDAKQFAKDLEEITAPRIRVRINSPGGSVFDAIAIHSALLHHPARIITCVDGLAASAASVIAMAGDEIETMPGGQWMIHDASATDSGNAAEKAKMQTFLDRQSQNLADMYARRAGGHAEEWRELMKAETWAFAQEAVDLGLSDRVVESERKAPPIEDKEMAERMARTFDVSTRYRYAGRRHAPAPRQMWGKALTAAQVREMGEQGLAMLRRAYADGIGEHPDALELIKTAVNADPATPENDLPTPAGPKGRSIALIEAQLAADE